MTNTPSTTEVPEGYMRNALGHLVPRAQPEQPGVAFALVRPAQIRMPHGEPVPVPVPAKKLLR